MTDAFTAAAHAIYGAPQADKTPAPTSAAAPRPEPAAAPSKPAADGSSDYATRFYEQIKPKPEPYWLETLGKENPIYRREVDDEPTIGQQLYAHAVPTRSSVDWDEPAATDTREFHSLERVPEDLQLPEEEAALGEYRFREAMVAAGAGPTLARELWSDAIRGHREPVSTTPQQCAEKLQQRYGREWEMHLTAARELVQAAAVKCPEIVRHLEQTGLGNSPDFIAKLARRAARVRGGN